MFPEWAHDGGPARLVEVLSSEEARERLRQEVVPRGSGWDEVWLTYFRQPHNRKFEGRSVAEIADALDMHPVDALCDLLLDEELPPLLRRRPGGRRDTPRLHSPPPVHGRERRAVAWRLPRFPWPTAPSRRFCRCSFERRRKLPMQEAIRKMTSYPAQRLGLPDRGLLMNGMNGRTW